jgi:ubiquinone/menaquinone biosynthesis C-methylase UbiE
VSKTIFNFIKSNKFLNQILSSCQEARSKDFWSRIQSHIPARASILDIGAGTCHMTALLQNQALQVTPLDIVDMSFIKNTKPVIYDGFVMPFADNTFDVALILTVLHHCLNPEQIIREARRVARKVIIIEDVVRGRIHTALTKSLDSLMNLEFIGHPHQNKTDEEWCCLFDRLGLRLLDKTDVWSFLLMWQVTYVLEVTEA